MREENSSENRAKASSKFGDQNQPPKSLHTKTISNQSKPKSSWGSHIVKGFTGTADKKTKVQTITVQTKKPPLSNSDLPNTNPVLNSHSRVKRSLITDLSCSVNATQVHPQVYQTHRRQSSGSRDLFIELDHVRSLLQESKEREFKLQAELGEWKTNVKVLDLEKQLETRNIEVDNLSHRVGLLECEKTSLCDQLATLTSILERNEENLEISKEPQLNRDLEMEVVELRRLNKELQMQKRNLACKLSSLESQLASLAKANESDVVAKAKAEASMLRHTNENLSKQVEGLQMSRLNEVEELAYLRWVNSCLRDELRNSCSTTNSDKPLSPVQSKVEYIRSPNSASCKSSEHSSASVKRLNFIKKMKKWSITSQEFSSSEYAADVVDKEWVHIEELRSPGRRHSISGSKCYIQELIPNKRRQSDGFMCIKEMEEAEPLSSQKPAALLSSSSLDFEKRALRIPNPPPRPSCSIPFGPKDESCTQIPPPPPPLPPKFSVRSSAGVVKRAPQVVEFYHSLMKRGSRKDSTNGGICDVPDVANVRSSMIGEIENRSSHLMAIKADVETQGEFVNSLIREVNDAVYQNIEDVVAFVKWLDDELCYLVDERAVLKHFAWPEKKADTLREAAFGYRDLKKLESEVLYYKDDSRVPCDIALKKMVALSEKMERTVYNLLRTRESLMRNCREFQIPTDWMLDNGIISKIKLGSVKLAKRYMKRVAMELQSKATLEKDPSMDYMLLQGVRFAFRIHQFAGGFDSETMHAFEELRNLANLLNKK
ncbi:peroxisome bioproteinsis protein 7 [Hibiscus syriacus]|uniref:Peroxisome bioproteinsis protein 7 n=1 Tax=Hibiscus syriacus TaxID=106335 RepID=A0A6A3BGY7_HIBSY|nr:protein CHUP1, chloroplastic-like [Hibiscus syriacus]KAE8714708.1 peroxisome bioproteinsis protein 7 [Hibiscus syriacus]